MRYSFNELHLSLTNDQGSIRVYVDLDQLHDSPQDLLIIEYALFMTLRNGVRDRSQGGHIYHINQRYHILAILVAKEHDECLLRRWVRAINACLEIIDQICVEVLQIALTNEMLGEPKNYTQLLIIIVSLRTHHEVGKAARIQKAQKYIGFLDVPGVIR
jgi:hypothetical protein